MWKILIFFNLLCLYVSLLYFFNIVFLFSIIKTKNLQNSDPDSEQNIKHTSFHIFILRIGGKQQLPLIGKDISSWRKMHTDTALTQYDTFFVVESVH